VVRAARGADAFRSPVDRPSLAGRLDYSVFLKLDSALGEFFKAAA
jgi:hypothetical protein